MGLLDFESWGDALRKMPMTIGNPDAAAKDAYGLATGLLGTTAKLPYQGAHKPMATEVGGGRPKAPEESVQEIAARRWGENYSAVVNTSSLSDVATVNLERAQNYGNRLIQSEYRKGWSGLPVNTKLIDAMRPDMDAIAAELKRRRASTNFAP